jgi:hypothetical protein
VEPLVTHPLSCLLLVSVEHRDGDPPVGMFTSDDQKARIANLHSRIRTHYRAVQEAEQRVGAEPELVEYIERWRTFMRKLNALSERANAVMSWVTDDEIKSDEWEYDALIREWDLVAARIKLRRANRTVDILEAGLRGKTVTGEPLPMPTPEEVADFRRKHPTGQIEVPDVDPHLPVSAATKTGATPEKKPPEEPEVPLAVKLAALFTLAATSVAAVTAMKSDGQRFLAAGAGMAVTGVAGWAMFSPETPKDEASKKKDEKKP